MAKDGRVGLVGITLLFGLIVVLGVALVAFLWTNLNDVLAGDLGLRRIGAMFLSLSGFAVFLAGTGRVLRRFDSASAR